MHICTGPIWRVEGVTSTSTKHKSGGALWTRSMCCMYTWMTVTFISPCGDMCLAQNWQDKWHGCQCLFVSKALRGISMRQKSWAVFAHQQVESSWFLFLHKHVHAHTNVSAAVHAIPRENVHKCEAQLTPPVGVDKRHDASVTDESRAPSWPLWPNTRQVFRSRAEWLKYPRWDWPFRSN